MIDAKYKTGITAPSRDDQYQMFAYSHLVGEAGVQRVLLIYPAPARSGSAIRGRTDPRRPVRLTWLSLPFPSPDSLRGIGAWQHYLAHAADRFVGAVSTAA